MPELAKCKCGCGLDVDKPSKLFYMDHFRNPPNKEVEDNEPSIADADTIVNIKDEDSTYPYTQEQMENEISETEQYWHDIRLAKEWEEYSNQMEAHEKESSRTIQMRALKIKTK